MNKSKPFSVRLLLREYVDGSVELGEEAKAYALHIKEMSELSDSTSVLLAPYKVAKPQPVTHPLKDSIPGNISEQFSRCKSTPPTGIIPMSAKLRKLIEFAVEFTTIEANLLGQKI